MRCPFCRGIVGRIEDCDLCGHSGRFKPTRCPSKFVDDSVDDMLAAYRHYKAGFLPAAGGMQDQTRHFVAAIAYLEQLFADYEADAQAEADGTASQGDASTARLALLQRIAAEARQNPGKFTGGAR